MRWAVIGIGAALAVATLVGCRQGERAFLQVQFCLDGPSDAGRLKQEFQAIAHEERMRFLDRSAQTQAELEIAANATDAVSHSFPLINIGVQNQAKGFGATVGNLGLGEGQVAVGFGPDRPEARSFAERVLARLRRRWTLVPVPGDRGAFPLDCSKRARSLAARAVLGSSPR